MPNPLLAPRQNDVLALWQEGFTTKQIAHKLNIAFGTAKIHIRACADRVGPLPSHRKPAAPKPWRHDWDLSTIPDDLFAAEVQRRSLGVPQDRCTCLD